MALSLLNLMLFQILSVLKWIPLRNIGRYEHYKIRDSAMMDSSQIGRARCSRLISGVLPLRALLYPPSLFLSFYVSFRSLFGIVTTVKHIPVECSEWWIVLYLYNKQSVLIHSRTYHSPKYLPYRLETWNTASC